MDEQKHICQGCNDTELKFEEEPGGGTYAPAEAFPDNPRMLAYCRKCDRHYSLADGSVKLLR